MEKSDFFFPFPVSIVNSFLVRGRTWCPLSLLHAGHAVGLNLCMSCVCWHGCCEFKWVSVLLCPEDSLLPTTTGSYSFPLAFTTSPYPRSSNLRGGVQHRDFIYAECSIVSLYILRLHCRSPCDHSLPDILQCFDIA